MFTTPLTTRSRVGKRRAAFLDFSVALKRKGARGSRLRNTWKLSRCESAHARVRQAIILAGSQQNTVKAHGTSTVPRAIEKEKFDK